MLLIEIHITELGNKQTVCAGDNYLFIIQLIFLLFALKLHMSMVCYNFSEYSFNV